MRSHNWSSLLFILLGATDIEHHLYPPLEIYYMNLTRNHNNIIRKNLYTTLYHNQYMAPYIRTSTVITVLFCAFNPRTFTTVIISNLFVVYTRLHSNHYLSGRLPDHVIISIKAICTDGYSNNCFYLLVATCRSPFNQLEASFWTTLTLQGDVDTLVWLAHILLTHWDRDKMAAISQTTFSNAFSWMKMFKCRLKFHWTLFPRVHWQLTISQRWFR